MFKEWVTAVSMISSLTFTIKLVVLPHDPNRVLKGTVF